MTLCTRCKRTDPSCGFRWEKRRGRPKSWCRDCENAYQREYYQRNLDVARARNAAVMRAARRDPEKRLRMQAIQRRCWENGGRERAREYKQRKKTEDFFGYMVQFARRFNQAISPDDLRAMWERQEGRCGLTGRPLEMIAGRAQIDHILPQARGGGHELENLRWVCREANLAKRDLTDEEFFALCSAVAEWIGRRLLALGMEPA